MEEKEEENEKEEKISLMCESIGRQIFIGKLSVSPYFLHHYENINEAGILLPDKLSLKTVGVYLFSIF